MSMWDARARRAHWRRTRSLAFFVLFVWAIFALLVHWFAASLNARVFMGFPLGFYMAAQGSLIVFVVLLLLYNWRQDRIDDRHGYSDE